MKLNEEKCKELRISFSKVPRDFNLIIINNKSVRVVKSVKLLGLSFDNKLTWNLHIKEVVKKVSKRIYYLTQLKRASIPWNDLVFDLLLTMVSLSFTIRCQNICILNWKDYKKELLESSVQS